MTWKERFLRISHLWFVLLLLIQILPNHNDTEYYISYIIGFAVLLETSYIFVSIFSKQKEILSEIGKLWSVLEIIVILWEVFGQKLGKLNAKMFPAPGIVFHQFLEDIQPLLLATWISVRTILEGYLLALAIAIPLRLVLGWAVSIRSTANYIVRFTSAIPPIVYIPYAIALFPTLNASKVFIIFVASFWPVLAGTMTGVINIEQGVLNSAKTLGVKPISMIINIIFPGALPYIFNGANQGLGISFILLTSAEMIAADSTNPGLGFYIWNFSNFANYKRVIPAIVVLGITICLISFIIKQVQDYLLRWRATA